MEDIFPILDVLGKPGKKILATIIGVKGSVYKKEGSTMIFFEDGTRIGLLSAGCLETDLSQRVQVVFWQQKPVMVQYDLQEETDLGWGRGTGCNGTIDILLEPVTEGLKTDLLLVKNLLNQNEPVSIIKKMYPLGEYVFMAKNQKPFGNWSGLLPEKDTAKMGVPIFHYTYQPRPRLYVFGAGPDAIPLVSLAAETGFSVTVCDWREGFCQKKFFPRAERILTGFPKELFKQISFSKNDFAVIMSHDFQKDQEILMVIKKENIKYLGVLGPRERTERLLKGKGIPDWIDSPLGIKIGARGAVEIAVSAVAKMIEEWRSSIQKSEENLWTVPK